MKNIITWIVILLILSLIIMCGLRIYFRGKILSDAVYNNKISEMLKVNLSGIEQEVLIEGKSDDLPILIILHGGPFMPLPFGNSQRGMYTELTDNFIVVQWDQYGCGNNQGHYENLGINDYVYMSKELIEFMKNKYPSNELYVLGISSGTILGASVANLIPESIDKYISYGTIVNLPYAFNDLGDRLLSVKLSNIDKDKVLKLLQDYNYKNLTKLDRIGKKYDTTIEGINKDNSVINSSLIRMFLSPDYSIDEVARTYFQNSEKSKAFEEILTINMTETIKSIEVPFYVIRGKEDNITPHTILENIINEMDNANYYELNNSGHIPTKEDFKVLINYLIDLKNK